ncbi:MAG: hypothetical protein WCN88_02410 [Candidatus Falkowbacteria bacterium]
MPETNVAEREVLDPEIIVRFENLIKNEIVTNDILIAILESLEKDGKKVRRKQKKERKKGISTTDGEDKEYRLTNPLTISYLQSERVWGSWSEKEKNLPVSSTTSKNQVFSDSAYVFQKVYLRGLSVYEMAKRFPDHNWGKYVNDRQTNVAGCYLISLENPLSNRSPNFEKEAQPRECSRLDFNLTVELLLTLHRLGQKAPDLFYRTSVINGHLDEVCVGIIDGKINFLSEDKVRVQKKMAICLTKDEAWIS